MYETESEKIFKAFMGGMSVEALAANWCVAISEIESHIRAHLQHWSEVME
ncbi:MAG: hypothetical protein ACXQTL_05495 [Methanosarcinales archaeon]